MIKKITYLVLLFSLFGFSQIKTTGNLNFVSGLSAKLDLNEGTSTITLTLSGPSDRWFAFKLGSFTEAMSSNVDGVYYNGTTVVDGNGGTLSSSNDNQDWSLTSNTVNSGTRTIVATRAFNTGDNNDYVINFENATIDVAAAFGPSSGSYVLEYHGSNRAKFINWPLTALGVEDFTLNATQIYPNPSNGDFFVKAKTNLEEINIYSQIGSFVKTIKVGNSSNLVEVSVNGLQSGIYLIELVNSTEKSWKKIIIE
jgi:hypothetical protein